MIEYDIINSIKKKTEKTEMEYMLLKYHYTLSIITNISIEESKMHISSEEALEQIRQCMRDNL